ncbi:GntR family transcriptional regulator [Sphingobium sp. IP1]|jgi:DNA-binding transcriptional MocR family regulator|uniref:GntR family transcriptional regulator n=1 Tax=Sphingobium sp. IP1 TaxID=2021637 RepID=UPI00044E66B9|nr:GntR family transcriptional regulator [Sphingobium sp. IP1]EZP70611.1 Regulatory protein GntR, HTH [Sphingomonas paucimobilis]PHP17259.1 GntR family transcriptional regulator [Sphingobium sp. IP1]
MPALEPITHDRIYRTIKAHILAGQFSPGAKLTATRIAGQHEASITPVREAIYRLVGEGLVEMTPEGFHVKPSSRDMLLDILDLSQKLLVVGLQRWTGPPPMRDDDQPRAATPLAEEAVQLLEMVLVNLFAASNNKAILAWGEQANERLRWIRTYQCRGSKRALLECVSIHKLAEQRDRARLGRQLLAHHRRCARAIVQHFLSSDQPVQTGIPDASHKI